MSESAEFVYMRVCADGKESEARARDMENGREGNTEEDTNRSRHAQIDINRLTAMY